MLFPNTKATQDEARTMSNNYHCINCFKAPLTSAAISGGWVPNKWLLTHSTDELMTPPPNEVKQYLSTCNLQTLFKFQYGEKLGLSVPF